MTTEVEGRILTRVVARRRSCPRKANVVYVLSSANLCRLELSESRAAADGREGPAYSVDRGNLVSFSSTPTSIDYKQLGPPAAQPGAAQPGAAAGGLRATVSLEDGMLVHVDVLTRKVLGRFKCTSSSSTSGSKDHSSHVVHVSWDPLSSQYFAAAHKDGNLSLWDADSTSAPIFSFAKQPSGSVRSVVWMPGVPGGFLTFSARGGVIRIWNVSNPTPLASVKVDCSGIRDICIPAPAAAPAPAPGPAPAPAPAAPVALCAFADRVAALDLDTRRVVWETPPGHVDTVFTCAFHPREPDLLLTAGYDQRVKEWEVLTGRCARTFPAAAGGLIYDMKPRRDGAVLAAALDSGEVKLFEYRTGLVAGTLRPPGAAPASAAAGGGPGFAAYFVSWYPSADAADADGDELLVGYGNGLLQLVSPRTGAVRASLRVGGPKERVSGAVDPHDRTRLAVVAGPTVHIVGVDLEGAAGPGAKPVLSTLVSLSAADRRSSFFAVAFSPLAPGTLAATSDDQSVSVLRLAAAPEPEPEPEPAAAKKSGSSSTSSCGTLTLRRTRTLWGHTKKARAVVWHPELPWLLLTSSWDGSVIAWDVRAGDDQGRGAMVCSALGHSADVYGLAVHPSRPFVLATTSRDSTIRFWELAGRFRVPALRAIVGEEFAADGDKDAAAAGSTQTATATAGADPMLLCGAAGARLSRQLRELRAGIERAQGQVKAAPDAAAAGAAAGPSGAADAPGAAASDAAAAADDEGDPLVRRVRLISEFFFMPLMHRELWALVRTMKRSRLGASLGPAADAADASGASVGGCVPHVSVIERSLRQQAVERRTAGLSRSFGMGALARRQALQEAADLYMKVGDTRSYCEVMVQMGDWQRALMLAPAVGMGYWRELLDRHTREQLAGSGGAAAAEGAARDAPGRLTAQMLEELTPLMVVTGRHEKLVNLMIMNEKYDDACAITKMAAAAAAAAPQDEGTAGPASAADGAPADAADADAVAADADAPQAAAPAAGGSRADAVRRRAESERLERIRYQQAGRYMARGCSIEAACCHLSVDDVDGCLAKLLRGDEIELALLLMQAIGPRIRQPTEALLYMFGVLASDVDLPSVAFRVVEGMQMRLLERTVITVRHCARLSDAEADAFHAAHGMRSIGSYAEEAASSSSSSELRKGGGGPERAVERLRLLLLARRYADAVDFGLRRLRETLSRRSWCKEEVLPIVRLISLVDIGMLRAEAEGAKAEGAEDQPGAKAEGEREAADATTTKAKGTGEASPEQLIIRVMFYASYVAALSAMQQGYISIVRSLLTMAIDCAAKITDGAGPSLPPDVLILERERFSAQHEASVVAANVDAVTKNVIVIDNVETAVEKMPSSRAVGAGFGALRRALEAQLFANPSSLSRGAADVVTRHGSIPSHSEFKRSRSILGRAVKGQPCILEDGKSFMSVDDALAWRRLCAFSPLCTGRHMPSS